MSDYRKSYRHRDGILTIPSTGRKKLTPSRHDVAEMIDAFRKANKRACAAFIVTGSAAPSAPAPIYRRAPRPRRDAARRPAGAQCRAADAKD